jgi:hypothetical protein
MRKSFITRILHQIKVNEMAGECGTHGREMYGRKAYREATWKSQT